MLQILTYVSWFCHVLAFILLMFVFPYIGKERILSFDEEKLDGRKWPKRLLWVAGGVYAFSNLLLWLIVLYSR